MKAPTTAADARTPLPAESSAAPSTPSLGFQSTSELEPITGLIGQSAPGPFSCDRRSATTPTCSCWAAGVGKEHGCS